MQVFLVGQFGENLGIKFCFNLMAVICENILQEGLHFLYYPFEYENLDKTELCTK